MSLFDVDAIEKVYPDGTRALRGISLAIEKGEFVSIMGPSGSGKSTLLHILGLLDTPTSGTYRFDGKSIDTYTEDERAYIRNKQMGFVFQAFNLLSRTSVLENVKLPLLYSSIPESTWNERARSVLEDVNLTHRLDHEPSQISGGEKQRVAIARALVNNPEVIFADEPTGNLDTKSGDAVMEVIRDLHKKGHTIILITHERPTAEYADRIIHIKDGAIKENEILEKNGL